MTSIWNDDHFYTKNFKKIMLGLGLFVAVAIGYVTYLSFETRVINQQWAETFTTPKEYWSVVPKWEWKPVIENHLESKNV